MNDGEKVLLVLALVAFAKFPRRGGWQKPAKGGRGAGPGASTVPTPAGGTTMWSEDTMRTFVREMANVPIDPELVLLSIAAASNFNADEYLGSNTGLLMVRRQDLSDIGYPGTPKFEELAAPQQIPWIARVLAYRIASTGGVVPRTVGDLAVMLNPSNPTITDMLRTEADRRAEAARGTMLYIQHHQLLQQVWRTQ